MSTLRIAQAYRGGHNGAPGWWLHLSYDEEGVEALKSSIPAAMRTWDEEHKRWWVHEQAEESLLKVVPGLEAFRKQGALL